MNTPLKMNEDHVVVVETLADIHRSIQEFLPENGPENPLVEAKIKDGNQTYKVTAPTECTYKDMLIQGFQILKKRVEAMEIQRDIPIANPINLDGHMWLDDLIKRRLGGVRDGLRVKWTIKEGIFFFDPFSGKLTKYHG